MVGVPPDIDRIVKCIVEGYRPERVYLYGSHAWGKPDRHSDIDLLIVKRTGERPIDRRVAVLDALGELRGMSPVEAVVLTPEEVEHRLAMGDVFVRKILDHGRRLHG